MPLRVMSSHASPRVTVPLAWAAVAAAVAGKPSSELLSGLGDDGDDEEDVAFAVVGNSTTLDAPEIVPVGVFVPPVFDADVGEAVLSCLPPSPLSTGWRPFFSKTTLARPAALLCASVFFWPLASSMPVPRRL